MDYRMFLHFHAVHYNIGIFSYGTSTSYTGTTQPKFNVTRAQTYDLQIMDSIFHVPETLAFQDLIWQWHMSIK